MVNESDSSVARTSVGVPIARVQKAGEWTLVSCGSWEISVAPDGLLTLPRHLHPRDFEDFVACAQVAVDVSNHIIAGNEARAAQTTGRGLSTRRAIVSQGGPPAGASRMRTTTAQQRSASIGRSKGRSAKFGNST